jgi:hypothetical protein
MQQLMTQLGAVVGTTVMITIHESTMSSGIIQSYGFALLSGAFVAGLGIVAASATRPLQR